MTARDRLAEHLKPLLPASWVIKPYSKELERIDKTVVMLHATEIRPAVAAPGSGLEVDYSISVTTPLMDSDAATAALDDDVTDLSLALWSTPWLMYRNANPSLVSNRYAWDINITVITRKDA